MIDKRTISSILKRNGSLAKYNRKRIATAISKAMTAEKRPNAKLSNEMAQRVESALVSAYGENITPTVEDIQDVVESVLLENGFIEIARSYIIYRHRRAMMRATRATSFEVSDNIPYKKIYEVLRWNMEHHCDSVDALNEIIASGEYSGLVGASERRYQGETGFAAAMILERLKDLRIVIVAGPSSSGKTTTMLKISERLKAARVGFKAINLDHYFFNIEDHPRDEFGDYDYETPQALDLELINEHLVQRLAGKMIKTPNYDFKTGQRTLDVHEFSLGKDDLLLIDSLHGLYDSMTDSIPPQHKFKLYIETLGQFRGRDGDFIRWADNRLLRRMIRDKDHRHLRPIATLTHWHYVRRSELRNIIPFIGDTDFIVNSALPYELPLLRHRLFRYIAAARDRYVDDPKRLDAHIRVSRVYDLLKPLKSVKDDSCVPANSLIREFIGGSRYKY